MGTGMPETRYTHLFSSLAFPHWVQPHWSTTPLMLDHHKPIWQYQTRTATRNARNLDYWSQLFQRHYCHIFQAVIDNLKLSQVYAFTFLIGMLLSCFECNCTCPSIHIVWQCYMQMGFPHVLIKKHYCMRIWNILFHVHYQIYCMCIPCVK